MKKIGLDDIQGLAAYENIREEFRREIIELKKKRRVAVGAQVTLVFENRKTVIFQIQEMLRAERIKDLDKIREEVEVYNGLIPDGGELSATLLLEIEDQTHIREELLKFLGLDEAVFIQVGVGPPIRARFEEGHSKEDKISAVQYVRFSLDPGLIQAMVEKKDRTRLFIDHPHYKAETTLTPESQQSLAEDLMV